MSEKEPVIKLQIGDTEHLLRRDNARLYTFLGKAAFDHLFFTADEQPDPDILTGTFIPRDVLGTDQFDGVADYMRQNKYPLYENMPRVPDSDEEIITRILGGKDVDDINDEFPDWLPQV